MSQLSAATYIMEDAREANRLERKVDSDAWVTKYLKPYLFPGAEVLSVGCGPGSILRSISKSTSVLSATGLDISPLRIRQAIERNPRNPRLRFSCGDARQMQFASDSFDVIYTRMLLQYIVEKEQAIAEMVRVCRPGGLLLMQDLDGQLVWHYPEDAIMHQTLEKVMHALAQSGFDPFVGRKLFWLARQAGLKNIQVQVESYHLIAGEVDPAVMQQWELKLEIARPWLEQALEGEHEADTQIRRFLDYLKHPDTLTYSNVFTVTGEKPL
jgi:ubiquinone/menaquinone biosynthesis C-methylase UbiE